MMYKIDLKSSKTYSKITDYEVIKNLNYKSFGDNRKYIRATRIFKKFLKKNMNKTTKKFNIRILYKLSYGNKFNKENYKKVIFFYNLYYYKENKFRSIKHLKLFCDGVEVKNNFVLFNFLFRSVSFKDKYKSGVIREQVLNRFGGLGDEKIMSDLLKDCIKNIEIGVVE